MRKITLAFFILTSLSLYSQSDSVRYELYVKCCMGIVSHNIYDFSYSVYKDSIFICYLSDKVITLPDTGLYTFKNKENIYKKRFYKFDLYSDTFEIKTDFTNGDLIWNPKTKKYKFNDIWRCDNCIMDGYLSDTCKNGLIKWEGLYKEGIRIWFKSYDEDGNLIYYTKRNFWGKEKVKLDKRFDTWRRKKKEENE